MEVNPAFAKQSGVSDLIGKDNPGSISRTLREDWLKIYDNVLGRANLSVLKDLCPW